MANLVFPNISVIDSLSRRISVRACDSISEKAPKNRTPESFLPSVCKSNILEERFAVFLA